MCVSIPRSAKPMTAATTASCSGIGDLFPEFQGWPEHDQGSRGHFRPGVVFAEPRCIWMSSGNTASLNRQPRHTMTTSTPQMWTSGALDRRSASVPYPRQLLTFPRCCARVEDAGRFANRVRRRVKAQVVLERLSGAKSRVELHLEHQMAPSYRLIATPSSWKRGGESDG